MEDNSRFLIAQKEVAYGEDFIIDIPLSLDVKSINAIMISSTCNQLKFDIKSDTLCPYFSNSFGYGDFLSRINPSHIDFNRDWADLINPNIIPEYNATIFLRYAQLKCISREFLAIIDSISNLSIITWNEVDRVYDNVLGKWIEDVVVEKQKTLEAYYATFHATLRKIYYDRSNKDAKLFQFETFFDINFLSTFLDFTQKVPYNFDYASYLSGTMTVSVNGEDIILRNTRVTLNQLNKTLQNNLISLGDITCNNGFLRCAFFQGSSNMLTKSEASLLKNAVIDDYYHIDRSKVKLMVKFYVKFTKQD